MYSKYYLAGKVVDAVEHDTKGWGQFVIITFTDGTNIKFGILDGEYTAITVDHNVEMKDV
jgi:hypothetical protein